MKRGCIGLIQTKMKLLAQVHSAKFCQTSFSFFRDEICGQIAIWSLLCGCALCEEHTITYPQMNHEQNENVTYFTSQVLLQDSDSIFI
jgi:hypothetical protein